MRTEGPPSQWNAACAPLKAGLLRRIPRKPVQPQTCHVTISNPRGTATRVVRRSVHGRDYFANRLPCDECARHGSRCVVAEPFVSADARPRIRLWVWGVVDCDNRCLRVRGAYFAGRCAPVIGWLHGLLAWAVMILSIVFGLASIIGGAVSVAANVASTGATVSAASAQTDAGNSAINSLSQQAQSAIASITAAASSPAANADARQAADTAARTVAQASWFSVAALLVGAVIALGAGGLGFRHQPAVESGSRASRSGYA